MTLAEIDSEVKLRTDLFDKIKELNKMENPFSADDVKDLDARIAELDKELEAVDIHLQDLITDRDNTEADLVVEQEYLDGIISKIEFDSLESLYKVKGEIEQLTSKLDDLKNAKNPHMESFKELKAVKLEPIDMDSVNALDKKLTHQNYLLKLLTKKDSFIRKNLLNKNLTFLNQRLRGYLSDLGLPHRVEFTQEMTAHISQFGRQLDFGNLSSGQKARVNLALSFSFRDVLQRSLDSVNVCMLDEVLDVGLDSVGVQNAAHMLKRKSRDDDLTLFIISHRDEVSGIFDKTLTVRMEKGFSNIIQEG
jgi:DNA repair exonuclease SbcCD ATPase subunit